MPKPTVEDVARICAAYDVPVLIVVADRRSRLRRWWQRLRWRVGWACQR